MPDMDHHSGAVNVFDPKSANLPDRQTCGISTCQRRARLQARNGLEELNNFFRRQNNGKLPGFACVGDPLGNIILRQRDAVKEPEGADDLVQRRPRYPG